MQTSQKVKFKSDGPLRAELVRRVDAYFAETGLSKTGGPSIALKAFVLIPLVVTAYVLMVAWAGPWWQVALCAASVGLAISGIGLTIMHDGSHDAATNSRFWNRLAAATLDLVGGSSYMWRFKHVVIHHTWPNVEGVDDDIEAQPFLRLSPTQTRYVFHRIQHLYVWLIYSFLPPKWHFVDDFTSYITGTINGYRIPRPKGWDAMVFFGGKLFFLTWLVAIPLALGHSALWILGAYAVIAVFAGVSLATTFQLAHSVRGAEFTEPVDVSRTWAEHQLATTVNFAPGHPVVSWLLGGLNHQVEHHLFPRICSVHYPALYRIVDEVCTEFGVERAEAPTLWGALRTHLAHLKALGRAVGGAPDGGARDKPAPAVPVA